MSLYCFTLGNICGQHTETEWWIWSVVPGNKRKFEKTLCIPQIFQHSMHTPSPPSLQSAFSITNKHKKSIRGGDKVLLKGLSTAQQQRMSCGPLNVNGKILSFVTEPRTTLLVPCASPSYHFHIPQKSYTTIISIQHPKQLGLPQDSWRRTETAMLLNSRHLPLWTPVLTGQSPAKTHTFLGLNLMPQRHGAYNINQCSVT